MSFFFMKNFHAAPPGQFGMPLYARCAYSHACISVLILSVCLVALCTVTNTANAQCQEKGCGVVGNSVDALLAIPASATGFLACPSAPCCNYNNDCDDHCVCRSSSWCGPVGTAVNRILAIPVRMFGSLTSHNTCGCDTGYDNCKNNVYYPRGCPVRYSTGTVTDVAPQTVAVPSYITYSIIDERRPVRSVPPVVTFSRPLTFDQ